MSRAMSSLMAIAIWSAWLGAFILFWVLAFATVNHFGFDNQATPQYGFTSGVGPMILTAMGMSTIVTGMWHAHNCHERGCWRLGRHKVKGTPWCNAHHEKARADWTAEDLLQMILEELRRHEAR